MGKVKSSWVELRQAFFLKRNKSLLRKKFLCDPLEGRVIPLNKTFLRRRGWGEWKRKNGMAPERIQNRPFPGAGDLEKHVHHLWAWDVTLHTTEWQGPECGHLAPWQHGHQGTGTSAAMQVLYWTLSQPLNCRVIPARGVSPSPCHQSIAKPSFQTPAITVLKSLYDQFHVRLTILIPLSASYPRDWLFVRVRNVNAMRARPLLTEKSVGIATLYDPPLIDCTSVSSLLIQ